MTKYCDDCLNKGVKCDICTMNPKYKSFRNFHKAYIAVCPIGHTDCVCDPGYIKHYYPKWYKELYGDKTPQEVAKTCFTGEDNNECWNYDDEDK